LALVQKTMFAQGFVWEFANGVEIGKLEKGGVLDEKNVEACFSTTVAS